MKAGGETKNEDRISGGRILKQFGHFLKNQHPIYSSWCICVFEGCSIGSGSSVLVDNLARLTHIFTDTIVDYKVSLRLRVKKKERFKFAVYSVCVCVCIFTQTENDSKSNDMTYGDAEYQVL